MIEPSVLRAMLAAGATAEMIVVAVEADYEAEMARIAERRLKARERKAAWRLSRGQRGTTGDNEGHSGTKERSPTPPKENNPLVSPTGKHSPTLKTDFEDFWKVYPRKVAKGAALKAYRNALNRASPEEILAGVRRYVASKPDPKFTAHPASWLNADRWLDEDAKPQTTAVVSGPWKPFSPETEPEKPPAEERQRQVERLLRRTASGMTA